MSKKLRVGIVGCGGIAGAHLRGYAADENVAVVVVYDKAARATAAFAKQCGADVAQSTEEMIKKHRLDAVSVCSPPAAHLENCRPFIDAAIPILCEKPIEVNAQSAAALAKLVRESGALFMPAFCHRFHPAVIELKKLIREGVLGEPLLFRNIFGGYNEIADNHRADPKLSGGGPLIDHCCHSVDLFRFLVGDPTYVQAIAGNIMQDLQIEDFGMFHLSVADRSFGEVTGSYSLKGCGNSVEWYGTKGCAVVSYFSADYPDLSYIVGGADKRIEVDCAAHPDRFVAEIGHFLGCVRKQQTPALTVEDGLKANQIVAALYESISRGARTAVDYRVAG